MLTANHVHTSAGRTTLLLCLAFGVLVLVGCGNMRDQPKFSEPYDSSPLFGSAARELEPNAVPVDLVREDSYLYEGTVNGEFVEGYPFEVTLDVLEEGRRQYEGFCSPCHGYGGYGDGVVAAEGYPQPAPASYHIDRLRDAPNGYYYQVITQGQGQMFSYASRIAVEDRWAIVAYIRALQFSQNAQFDELPAELQSELPS
jgi:mono/diheme cytochrome c family protein